jgi:hypothetical protein
MPYLSGRTISRDALLLQNVGPQKGFEALCIVGVGEGARVGIMRLVRIFGAGGIDRDIHPHQALGLGKRQHLTGTCILRDGRQNEFRMVLVGELGHLQQQSLGDLLTVDPGIFQPIICHFEEVDESRMAHQRKFGIFDRRHGRAEVSVAVEPHIGLEKGS